MQYRREIDGLRALAVLPVIFYHAGFSAFGGGFVGVDIFFVISGYLITSILLAERENGTFSLRNFYERRARRILPALLVVILACVPFAWLWLLPSDLKQFSDSVIAVLLFGSNILFWRTTGYFDTATDLKPLLHTWSLAVEEQFYLFFPLFLGLLWKWGRRRMLAVLAGIALVSLVAAHLGSAIKPEATFYLLPTRAWELLAGAFAAFYFSGAPKWIPPRAANEAGAAIGLALMAVAVFTFDRRTPSPSLHTVVPVLGALLIILCANGKTIAGKLLGHPVLVGVGLVSYSAYLWHQPLFAFARHRTIEEPPFATMASLCIATLVLAYFTWRFVELPFRSKQQRTAKEVYSYSGAASAALLAFGIAGTVTTGFLFRYDDGDKYLASLQAIEEGRYVRDRFVQLEKRPFSASDSRRKVLIVGDSYAQDLVNALYEAGFTKHIQIAVRHISRRCGNLFIERATFAAKIAAEDERVCQGRGLYEDANFRKQMQAADEIWFASAWMLWQAELLPRSLSNIQSVTPKPVRVFGRKDYGDFHIRELLSMPREQRIGFKSTVPAETVRINTLMKQTLGPGVYVDMQELMCGAGPKCALFNERAELITYDGKHLTSYGARHYGHKLAEYGLVKGVSDSRPGS